MTVLRNRTVAWAVLALVIAITTPLSGRVPIQKDKAAAENVYYHGVNNDDLCIDYDLKQASEAAKSLAAVCDAMGIENTLAQEASAVLSTTDISDRYDAFSTLSASFHAAVSKLENASLSDADAKKVAGYAAEFKSRENTIEHDAYNDYADAYNASISSFPANIISAVGGVGELEAFR